jgi:hypothetical protein
MRRVAQASPGLVTAGLVGNPHRGERRGPDFSVTGPPRGGLELIESPACHSFGNRSALEWVIDQYPSEH